MRRSSCDPQPARSNNNINFSHFMIFNGWWLVVIAIRQVSGLCEYNKCLEWQSRLGGSSDGFASVESGFTD